MPGILLTYVKGGAEEVAGKWQDHLARSQTPSNPDRALLQMVQGPADWLAFEAVDAVGLSIAKAETERTFAGSVVELMELEQAYPRSDFRPITGYRPLVFLSHVVPTDDMDHAAFEKWYDEEHIAHAATVGFRNCRRFRSPARDRYISVYEIDSIDVFDAPENDKVKGFHQFTPHVKYTRVVGRLV